MRRSSPAFRARGGVGPPINRRCGRGLRHRLQAFGRVVPRIKSMLSPDVVLNGDRSLSERNTNHNVARGARPPRSPLQRVSAHDGRIEGMGPVSLPAAYRARVESAPPNTWIAPSALAVVPCCVVAVMWSG